MKRSLRAIAAVGFTAGLLLLMAPPSSAGGPEALEVVVQGTASCLPSGEAELTWVATVQRSSSPGTSLIEIEGLTPQGEVSLAAVQFDGDQSGAATGPVTFDPALITVPSSIDSFPVASTAVALASGTTGGGVTLSALVVIFNPDDPEEFFTLAGQGDLDLPICEQPVVTEPSTAAAPAAETRPRFTG